VSKRVRSHSEIISFFFLNPLPKTFVLSFRLTSDLVKTSATTEGNLSVEAKVIGSGIATDGTEDAQRSSMELK
jgi:hypothetical protein